MFFTGDRFLELARAADPAALQAARERAPEELARARAALGAAQADERAVPDRASLLRAHATKLLGEIAALRAGVDRALWEGNNVPSATTLKVDTLQRQHDSLVSAVAYGEQKLPALALATLRARVELADVEQQYLVARQMPLIRELIDAHVALCKVDPAASPILELGEDSIPATLARSLNEMELAKHTLSDCRKAEANGTRSTTDH